MKLDNYKVDASENWESFKREFNHDMSELGDALKDITVDNKKQKCKYYNFYIKLCNINHLKELDL